MAIPLGPFADRAGAHLSRVRVRRRNQVQGKEVATPRPPSYHLGLRNVPRMDLFALLVPTLVFVTLRSGVNSSDAAPV
ncbi:hypothetical protein SAMN05444166_7123 [Singulisphaera sp. GP187]|nr:hypothetical protein SAMN05444166_7123 [Singulisphaera sp. GP187]